MSSSWRVTESVVVEIEMSNVNRQSFRVLVVPMLLIVVLGSVYVFDQYSQNSSPSSGLLDFSYASPESQGLSNETMEKLAETVRNYYDEELIAGAELVVIKNRRIVLHEVVGWKDRENEIPLEKNSVRARAPPSRY